MHKIAKNKEPMKKNLRKPLWHLNVCNIPHTLAVSLSNYRKLFTDRSFVKAIFNTLAITLLGLSLQLVVAMSIALVTEPTVSRQRLFPHHRADATWHPHHCVGHDHDLYL